MRENKISINKNVQNLQHANSFEMTFVLFMKT